LDATVVPAGSSRLRTTTDDRCRWGAVILLAEDRTGKDEGVELLLIVLRAFTDIAN
jgi:hypothetical protein